MNCRFQSEARQEYLDAIAYYEQCRLGLGQRFVDEVEEYLTKIREHPDAYATIAPEIRSANLHQFPYAIHFAFDSSEVFIIAVAHHSRRPGYWRHRLNPD
ncbi:MAG TPA: type II toxin-antitoxin system RelE/ParE family toxin [Planctomycetaceae bacterium]|nr:type II toxin-antitoxin system RelE/ParE family toxin [Planctomycetaceae bacterium]